MRRALLLALVLSAALNAAAGSGKVLILNSDKPGVGFNDLTPATPVGGNNGTTLGQQRLNVFQEAARRWQNSIDTNVDILVTATFAPIPGCTASRAVLGQATPMYWKHSFAGAPRENVWYPAALANKFAGTDLDTTRTDIFTQFNADVDTASCLSASDSNWYYGLDGNHGKDIDLFVVVLHEIGHGLGLAGKGGGSEFSENRPAVFNTQTLDLQAGLTWDQMSAEQRRVSLTNTANVVWAGENVRGRAASVLAPLTTFTITEPASIARDYDLGFAAFGPAAGSSPLSGRVVLALDGTADGSTQFDACSPLTNAADIAGNVAYVNRGTCTFVAKALNAQAAGATGIIIANVPSPDREETCLPPGMGGASDEIRIPIVSISTRDGSALKAQFDANAGVAGFLRVDPSRRLGGSSEGYVRLYAPCLEQPGSSIYHWDIQASPNLLMEPDINADLLHGLDLTIDQLLDIGWTRPPRTGRRILKR